MDPIRRTISRAVLRSLQPKRQNECKSVSAGKSKHLTDDNTTAFVPFQTC